MSSLKLGQVAELTERVRARLAEFGEGAFDQPSLGVIRLVYDVIEEWHEEQAIVFAPAPVGESPDAQLAEGVQIGLQLAAIKRDANRQTDPGYNLIKIRTGDAPRVAPATIADAHTNGGIANANGSTAGEVAAPESTLIIHAPGTLVGIGAPPPKPAPAPCLAETQEECDALIAQAGADAKAAVEEIGRRTRARDAGVRVSTDGVHISTEAATALGVEHTLVTPLKPRTLAEVDADEKRFAQLGSDEKAAQLRAIVNELRMLSAHGEMPSMAEWDERKPDDLPRAAAITQRHKLSWGRLAEYADLRFDLNERKARRHSREALESVAA